MSILTKKEMTEEDIKLQFITPAIQAKWPLGDISMETKITDGKINMQGNVYSRGPAKKADYILWRNRGNPLAVVEAKDNNHSISYGMQQAKEYADLLDVNFVYSSNGDGFQEYDKFTGIERTISLDEFPTKDELIERYRVESNKGAGLSDNEEKLLDQPYYTDAIHPIDPRYYQMNAVNKTIAAIAGGKKRILLAMATGTGKTYTAFQLVYRLLKSGKCHKILYLVDRNNLADQSIENDFRPLSKVVHKVNYAKDNKLTVTAHQVYFALYQQLIGDNDEERYKELFDKDFFDLIIVDECHRGSAKDDSNWRKILEYFDSAIQVGMTATPKETKYISNINYFGEPLYQYSLNEGIEDGFLAPFKVYVVKTNIGDGWRPIKGQRDIFGQEIEDRIYNNCDYDYNIIIEDRINSVAKEITDYLKANDRMAKTIVFCPTEEAAERMRIALANLNSDMMKKNSDYVVRITGSDDYGKSKLDYFISVQSKYPVIATTSQLLSTGADCKMVKLIAIDKNIGSMTEFKQIVGRGTRLREKEGKTHFVLMDFRGVARLFADEDWDGPIKMDDDYPTDKGEDPTPPPPPPPPPPPRKLKSVVNKEGCEVIVTQKIVEVYDSQGKLLKCVDIIDYTKETVANDFTSLENFIKHWTKEDKKEKIRDLLLEQGIDLEKLKKDQNLEDVDDFDFICHIAFDKKPLTRQERANNVKKRDIFNKYGEQAREVLNALLDRYADNSIYELEDINVLKLDPFVKFGKPSKIANLFGGKQGYINAIRELEEELYKVA